MKNLIKRILKRKIVPNEQPLMFMLWTSESNVWRPFMVYREREQQN